MDLNSADRALAAGIATAFPSGKPMPLRATGNRLSSQNDEPEVPAAELERRHAWMFVGAALQRGSRFCDDCDHRGTDREPRPYGDGTVYEDFAVCTLGQRASDHPRQCPAYAAHLESLRPDEPHDLARAIDQRRGHL